MAINTFTASGNIGRDCEVRYTPNNKAIATFPIPVKQGYGEHEKTSWVDCRMFGGMAEKLPQYLTKGVKVIVSGEFVLEKWTGQDGAERSKPVIIVRDLDFASSGQPQQSQQSFPRRQENGQQAAPQYNDTPMDYSDDIPFFDPYHRHSKVGHCI
ncbi:MAG: single-stranded DNA-binding protein [Vibrio sp.]